MFTPYRIIQVKQRKNQSFKNADISTKINTNELFQHCKSKPQKLLLFNSESNKKQFNKCMPSQNKEKNVIYNHEQNKNCYKEIQSRKDGDNFSSHRNKCMDVHKKSQRYKKIISDNSMKRCRTALNKSTKNMCTPHEEHVRDEKFDTMFASCGLDHQQKYQKRKMFFSIDLNQKPKARGHSSLVRSKQTKSIFAHRQQNQKQINFDRSKLFDENAFEFYANQLYNKRRRNLCNKEIQNKDSQGLQIKSYPRGKSQYSPDKKKQIQDLFRNWRNTRNMSISGRSIKVSKKQLRKYDIINNHFDDKNPRKLKETIKKQNTVCLIEGEIKAWQNQLHQGDNQQIQLL